MKGTGRRVNLAIFLTMAALFFGCFLTLLLRDAYDIQARMLSETEHAARSVVEGLEAVYEELGADAPRSEQLWRYQQAMADNDVSLSAAYPFRCVSFVASDQGGNWEVPVLSRNMIFLEITREDGTVQKLPLAFAHENSADVAQLLLNRDRIAYVVNGDYLEITGWWQDDLFYVQKLDTEARSIAYESPLEPPDTLETIYIKSNRSGTHGQRAYPVNAKGCGISVFLKSYGEGGSRAAFASQWEKDDELVSRFFTDAYAWRRDANGIPKNAELDTYVQDRSPFHTCILVRARLVNQYSQLFENRAPLYVGCAAEFSPMGLAWKQLFSGGTMPVLLLMFLLLGLLLNTIYTYTRRQELRSYQDEITRQARALEYAQNAEKSRREMTSAIAHELKTPIAVLSSYAEALQENIDAEKQSHYLTVIRDEAGKMDRMVLELLDLSRLEAGRYQLKRERFALDELFSEILNPLQHEIEEKHLHIIWQVERTEVDADRCRLGQVIENFMTNAIRHTPEGGKIVLRLGMAGETFSVENQGKPIPTEQLSKVWETFWQGDSSRSERGSGLGLAICRTIVSLHGGSCKAENTAAGVKFSVSLSEKQRLYQLGRMPREECVRIQYPIARWYTTVERVLMRLELLRGKELLQELQAGNIRVGSDPVRDKKTRLYAGYTLSWKEFRIAICQDDGEKRRGLLLDRMRVGSMGYMDGTRPAGWIGNPK